MSLCVPNNTAFFLEEKTQLQKTETTKLFLSAREKKKKKKNLQNIITENVKYFKMLLSDTGRQMSERSGTALGLLLFPSTEVLPPAKCQYRRIYLGKAINHNYSELIRPQTGVGH